MANEVVARIRAIARRRRVPKRHEKAAYATSRVESGHRNLNYGDADSEGWRQERKSLYKDPRNLDASINRFFDETTQHDRGQNSARLAADVQRPAAQYRGRYGDRAVQREAQALLGKGSSKAPKREGNASPTSATGGGQSGADVRRAALQQYVLTADTDPNAAVALAEGLAAAKNTPDPAPDARTAVTSRRRSSVTGAKNALAWAESKVGQPASKETDGPNRGKLADYANSRFGFGRSGGQPWCAMFTSMAVTKGGAPSSARTASVAEVRRKALAGEGYRKGLVSNPKAGDLVLFGDRHIGMVKSVDGDKIKYVGGNQSDSVTIATTSRTGVDVVRPKYKGGK